MSIKIMNGYILNVRPADIFSAVEEIRDKMWAAGEEELRSLAQYLIIHEYDRRHATDMDDRMSVIRDILRVFMIDEDDVYRISKTFMENKEFALSTVLDMHTRKCIRTDIRVPFDYSCYIQVHRVYNQILCCLYTQEDSMRKAFEQLPFVEEYSYWNNTDRPSSISEKEWNSRRDAWDKVGMLHDQSGMTINCMPDSKLALLFLHGKDLKELSRPDMLCSENRTEGLKEYIQNKGLNVDESRINQVVNEKDWEKILYEEIK